MIIRSATLADMASLVRNRRALFDELNDGTPEQLDRMIAAFEAWLPVQMERGTYRAWLALSDTDEVAAGVALFVYEGPPNIFDSTTTRVHIVDVYTYPAYRRQGLARRLMSTLIDWCDAQGYHFVTLRASSDGRPLYELLGFVPTTEMHLDFDRRREQ